MKCCQRLNASLIWAFFTVSSASTSWQPSAAESSAASRASNRTSSVRLRPAPRLQMPHSVDCNSPSHWDGGTFYVFNSTGHPYRSSGTDLFHLGAPQEVRFDNTVKGGRWIEASWRAEDGVLYGWYHFEPTGLVPGTGLTAPRIGALRSTDNGATWRDLGIVLEARANTLKPEAKNGYFAGGNGDFCVVLDAERRFLYSYFSNYAGELGEQGVAVARMEWKDRDAPVGKVFKWFEGNYTEPGRGGKLTPLFPAFTAWEREDCEAYWGPSIHWNTALNQYVMLLNRAKGKGWVQEGIYISFAPQLDGTPRWSPPQKILNGGNWYPVVAGLDSNQRMTDKLAGRVARFFMGQTSEWEILFTPPGEKESEGERHAVSREHPRLLGSRAQLQALAKVRTADYQRMAQVARGPVADDPAKVISMALVAAIEGDAALARKAQQSAMRYVNGPIRKGHVPFGSDLALCALVYDLCFDSWGLADRQGFVDYFNQTVDANVNSEPHVFHNGWYGYKNWGIGLAAYATYYENDRSPAILTNLEQEFRTRAAPALELAGDGGGFAEGYYIHYWLYEWLVLCEVARRCEGVDYYAIAPKFFANRAIASMFECYPGIREYGSRRCVPMGDGGGRVFGGDRDKALSARRILVNYYRDDPAHQAVHTFNEQTPRSSVRLNAYQDFLWRDSTVPKGDLNRFRLSHYSPGPGYVYARSSWADDATYFFFKCGDRFTAHQHLDVGHFLIYKQEELAGDGGHYDEFGTPHDVNYHLRTIAHSTMLVLDPNEKWPAIRAAVVTGNDGGQHHNWPHHNGAVADAAEWQKQHSLYDIADFLAYEDHGDYLYVAGDATRAYSTNKLEFFTRQIVYLRPDTFVIFDRVKSKRPEFKKTWLLQAMRRPEVASPFLVVTHDKGRLFIQPLLPAQRHVELVSGPALYQYGGYSYPPKRNTGPAPECRIEISPEQSQTLDYFLHILTAATSQTKTVPAAAAQLEGGFVRVTLGRITLGFGIDSMNGWIEADGRRTMFGRM